MEKHGKKSCHGKSWKSHEKWAEKMKSWKFKKVENLWNFSTAYRESRMRNSDNSISIGILQCFRYDRLCLCSKFQIVMLGKSKLKSF